jgi:hypothetical protein
MAQTLRRTLALAPTGTGMAAATQAETAASTVARGVAAVGLAAIGLIHLLDAPGKYSMADSRMGVSCAGLADLLVPAQAHAA